MNVHYTNRLWETYLKNAILIYFISLNVSSYCCAHVMNKKNETLFCIQYIRLWTPSSSTCFKNRTTETINVEVQVNIYRSKCPEICLSSSRSQEWFRTSGCNCKAYVYINIFCTSEYKYCTVLSITWNTVQYPLLMLSTQSTTVQVFLHVHSKTEDCNDIYTYQ